MSQFSTIHPQGIKIIQPDGSTMIIGGPNAVAETARVAALEAPVVNAPVVAVKPGEVVSSAPGQVKKIAAAPPVASGVTTLTSAATAITAINPALTAMIAAGIVTIVVP